jgi:hypothetical protein
MHPGAWMQYAPYLEMQAHPPHHAPTRGRIIPSHGLAWDRATLSRLGQDHEEDDGEAAAVEHDPYVQILLYDTT